MTPYLPTLTRLEILEGEAGNREGIFAEELFPRKMPPQTDSHYGLTLAREFGEEFFSPKSLMLIGGSYDETDSRKAS